MNTDNFAESLMDFDPSNLSIFKEPTKSGSNSNPNIYRTNPSLSKAEDGHYRSKVRIIYNPFNVEDSVVATSKYVLQDIDGRFLVDTKMAQGDKNNVIFKAWKKLWFDKTKDNKDFCKQIFNQSNAKYVLVQILEDDNQPDTVGQIKVWKLPSSVWKQLDAKMHPSPESKKAPVAVMDWVLGKPLEIDVTPGPDDPQHPERKQREISYDLCSFSNDGEPIIRTDGTALFGDAEMDMISEYEAAKAKIAKAKSEDDRKKKIEAAKALVPGMKELYAKAESYLKENAIDIVEEVGFKEWTPELAARVDKWISLALKGLDPSVNSTEDNPILSAGATATAKQAEAVAASITKEQEAEDELPF